MIKKFIEFINENKKKDFIIAYIEKDLLKLKDVLDVKKYPMIDRKYYNTLNYLLRTEFGFVDFTTKYLLKADFNTDDYYEIYNSDLKTGLKNDLGIDFKKEILNAFKIHFTMLDQVNDISNEIDLNFYDKASDLNVTPYIKLRWHQAN